MIRNVLEYLESTAEKYPQKTAFDDDKKTISYCELLEQARSIGSRLLSLGLSCRPVVVYLPKGCDCITAFMGIVYSGGFYCPIDITMPPERISLIFDVLKPAAIITNSRYAQKAEGFRGSCEIIIFDEAVTENADTDALSAIRRNSIDTDPLYVLFTSGSTGVPKGVVISHRAIIDFSENLIDNGFVEENDVIGNQGNFYFDLSVFEIYGGISAGATVVIIPKKHFLFPVDLIKYLNKKEITMINWVPSAICNVANLKALDVIKPQYLKKVVFCGEIMPSKQLNVWRKALPDVRYVNFYGPTEIVYACTFYNIEKDFEDDEPLPIGRPFENTKILVLNDDDQLVSGDEPGELCVAGTCLALGYYNNPEKTKEVFVQNPLNSVYEEKIYRTGDIVKYNELGELMYLSRKDFQIKHLGHRIELGEIETAAGDIGEIDNCACIYDDEAQEIVMCYTGTELENTALSEPLKKKLPSYMIPGRYVYFKTMPYNMNGKIDRLALKRDIKR